MTTWDTNRKTNHKAQGLTTFLKTLVITKGQKIPLYNVNKYLNLTDIQSSAKTVSHDDDKELQDDNEYVACVVHDSVVGKIVEFKSEHLPENTRHYQRVCTNETVDSYEVCVLGQTVFKETYNKQSCHLIGTIPELHVKPYKIFWDTEVKKKDNKDDQTYIIDADSMEQSETASILGEVWLIEKRKKELSERDPSILDDENNYQPCQCRDLNFVNQETLLKKLVPTCNK